MFTACESLPPDAERGPNGTIAHFVRIEASEPGAKIRVNDEVVGNTPLTLKIFGDTDGTFHDFGSFEYVIEALPVVTNQFAQVRAFQTGKMFSHEDRIPRSISFDMNRPSVAYAPPNYGGPGYYRPPPPAYYGPPGYYYGPRVYIGPPGYRRYHHHGHW